LHGPPIKKSPSYLSGVGGELPIQEAFANAWALSHKSMKYPMTIYPIPFGMGQFNHWALLLLIFILSLGVTVENSLDLTA